MDVDRRTVLAGAARSHLAHVVEAVLDSWDDLMPASRQWTAAAHRRARAAVAAALTGIVTLVEQGDLDDRTWEQLRSIVFANGQASAEEVAELLRTVRIVGLERLADLLVAEVGLTKDEQWHLQEQAAAFIEQMIGEREEPDVSAYQELLAELHRSGPDLR